MAIKARWQQNGLLTKDEMQTKCCYTLQDKTWASDPDGNEWEVFVVLEDDLAETSMCCVAEASAATEPAKSEISAADRCAPVPAPVSISRSIEKSCC